MKFGDFRLLQNGVVEDGKEREIGKVFTPLEGSVITWSYLDYECKKSTWLYYASPLEAFLALVLKRV